MAASIPLRSDFDSLHREARTPKTRRERADCWHGRRTMMAPTFGHRAESDQAASYPAAAKKFAHSAGVNSSMQRPMALHRPPTVRSAALRRSAFSLANAISIDGVDGSCSRRRDAP